MTESNSHRVSIHWISATILCVLALAGGIWLGRVAFVTSEEPAPYIVPIEVLDDDLEVSGQVQYFEDQEIYILSTGAMPPPSTGSVYQVWMQSGDIIVPAGVLNPNSTRFAYAAYDGRYETLFITEEVAPFGVETPAGDPVIEADLTTVEIEPAD